MSCPQDWGRVDVSCVKALGLGHFVMGAAGSSHGLGPGCVHIASVVVDFMTPVDGSPPGSSVHGVLKARIPEWVAMPFSRGIFLTQGSNLCLL